MEFQLWQILVLSGLGFFAIWDGINPIMGFNFPVIAGFVTGLILGDVQTGLIVGGTLQLLILGVGTHGGASIPDYTSGAILGTAFVIMSGQDIEYGITLAVPIGLLLIQFDVLARFANTFFQHKAEKFAQEGQYKKVEMCNLLGIFPWGLSRFIPIFLALAFGSSFVNNILEVSPVWLLNGLKVAGKILPSVGIGILLRYLPVNKFYPYLIIGFVAATFFGLQMTGVALIGIALASMVFLRRKEESVNLSAVSVGGIIDEDE